MRTMNGARLNFYSRSLSRVTDYLEWVASHKKWGGKEGTKAGPSLISRCLLLHAVRFVFKSSLQFGVLVQSMTFLQHHPNALEAITVFDGFREVSDLSDVTTC